MLTFVHISDTHFHRDGSDNAATGRFLAAVKNDFLLEGDDKFLLVTGDITDDGHPEQYLEAYKTLLTHGAVNHKHILVCPGNHDYGPSGNFYSEACAGRFDSVFASQLGYYDPYLTKREPVVRVFRGTRGTKVMTIGINACLETYSISDFACGEVGAQQLAALDAILSNPDAKDVPKLVYLHFHPFFRDDVYGEFEYATHMLKDADAFIRILSGRVDVLCFGHKHHRNMWQDHHGIPWVLAAGTTQEDRKVFVITVDGTQVAVQDSLVPSL